MRASIGWSRGRREGWIAVLTLSLLLLIQGQALGHPQILFANVSTEPAAPQAAEPFTIRVELHDSSGRAVTDLELALMIHQPGSEITVAEGDSAAEIDDGLEGDDGLDGNGDVVAEVPLGSAGESGVYRAEVPALPAGDYPFRLAEVVNGNIESNAVGELPVGGEESVMLELLMPPVSAGFGAWLVWLVGLPLLAGLLVTILVLTNRRKSEPE